jgi:hypothetical protein
MKELAFKSEEHMLLCQIILVEQAYLRLLLFN